MKLPRRNFLHLAAGAAAVPAVPRFARAQAYPTRPVTIIDAFAPGGNTDLAFKADVDFEPIGMVAEQPLLIVARKDFPPKDLKEFIAYVKTNAEKLNMAHA